MRMHQDDELAAHAFDLRIRVLIRLDEHDVVVAGVEGGVDERQHVASALTITTCCASAGREGPSD